MSNKVFKGTLKTRKLLTCCLKKMTNHKLTELISCLSNVGIKNPLLEIKKLKLPYAYVSKTMGLSMMFYTGYFIGDKDGELFLMYAKSKVLECRKKSF